MADEALLRELNNDVWHAFRSAYAARDAAAFLAVHAADLFSVGGPAKQVDRFDSYAAQVGQWFAAFAD